MRLTNIIRCVKVKKMKARVIQIRKITALDHQYQLGQRYKAYRIGEKLIEYGNTQKQAIENLKETERFCRIGTIAIDVFSK